jgi:hypothetical protein
MIMKATVMIGAAVAALSSGSSMLAAAADPCALLSETQVAAALGTSPMTVAKFGSDATHCHWEQPGKNGSTLADAHLLVETARTYDTAKGAMGMSGKLKVVPVGGLGDDAYYLVGSRDAPLFVKKGNSAFRIAFAAKGVSLDDIEAKEKALALAVLPKL